ncbi:tRNA pseudouridine(55) synthase TruB [Hymenobacter actinosclerus]|uniref:tRNA pseudouridine synthase B n=1 Tax=Hymenobacter actinosclerus TaxID=82805 RepID=A0A1I0AXV0_9BACT|nr:tRNA pseudouridine(55) synthase TruB [Hymenobacter actinosclerus]SES99274.1 tRNA pseudouridine synthase B [Hymenobacter actinosclerus]
MSEKTLADFDFETGEVLLVDKPLTWSSFDVVRKVKNALRIRKIGHAGTLDPLATGLLILCTGKKTKQIDLIQAQQKEYTGTFRLGQTTPSFDLETPVDAERPYEHLTEADIRAAVAQFVGEITQTPPLYSAVKVNGERAYEVARRGEEAVIKSKQVTIAEFELTRVELPEIDFRIACSKGTYIRSLARDLGAALHCGAHLTKLVRTRIGEYRLEDALTMARIEALRPPRPEGEQSAGREVRPPRRERQPRPERRTGLEYFQNTHAAPPTDSATSSDSNNPPAAEPGSTEA